MSYQINFENLHRLVPQWAGDRMAIAFALDSLLERLFERTPQHRPDNVYHPLSFCVELDLRCEPPIARAHIPTASPDLVGRLTIATRSCTGSECRIELPLNPLLKGYDSIADRYTMYCHAFQTEAPLAYLGITRRAWYERLDEHMASADGGSEYLFHRALREHRDKPILHRVLWCELDEGTALDLEHELIQEFTLYPLGLNMIPGGRAGLLFLQKLGKPIVDAEEKFAATDTLTRAELADGRSNPLCAARWAAHPDFSERILCGRRAKLHAAEVDAIRVLAGFGQLLNQSDASVVTIISP